MTLIFSFFILIPLIIEGLGVFLQKTSLSYYYYVLPVYLLFFFLIKKKSIRFPITASICYILFLIFSLISSVYFSVDKQISFEWWLFYLASFLVFIFFYNYKSEAKRIIKFIIVVATAIFVFSFLLKTFYPNLFFIKNLPTREFNLFFSLYSYTHNHLGDFLGLSLILIFISLYKNLRIVSLISFFALLILFLYSYSRSAYLSLSIIMSIFVFKSRNHRVVILFSTVLLLIITFFFLISSSYGKLFHLPKKNLFDSRKNYLQQGIQAIKAKPIFGFGMGNFSYASQKYQTNYGVFSETSHNFLVDILVENGFLAMLPLIFFLILLLSSAWRRQSIFSFLFFYLFIIFQTDYVYLIYSVMVIFMILAAIVYEEKNEIVNTAVFSIAMFFLFVIFLMIIISNILVKNNQFELAVRIYPFNKSAYSFLIQKKVKKGDSIGTIIIADKYKAIAPDDGNIIRTLAETYLTLGDKKKALFYFEKVYAINPYINFYYIQKLYYLKRELYGEQKAGEFLVYTVDTYKKSYYMTDLQLNQIRNLCSLVRVSGCIFKYFYEPKPNIVWHPNPQIPFSLVENKMNNDGLNNTQNFSIKKPTDVFRIMTLGGSETYGLYVKTHDNWPERLEALLNQKQLCPTIKKFEIINLAVDGYDLSYSIERYNLRGKKYNPDLIMIFIPNLYQLNEPLFQKISLYDQQKSRNKAYVQEVAKGSLYPAWILAMQDIAKEMDGVTILKQQNRYLNDLYLEYKGPILLLSYDYLSKNDQEFLQKTLKNQQNSSVFLIHNYKNKEYLFPDGNLNTTGHASVAQQLYNEITKDSNVCHIK